MGVGNEDITYFSQVYVQVKNIHQHVRRKINHEAVVKDHAGAPPQILTPQLSGLCT